MKKLLNSKNLVAFGLSVAAGMVAIYVVFRILPASIRAKITG